MEYERFIASTGVRIATAMLAAVCIASIGVSPVGAVLVGLLSAVGLIFSFRSGYEGWMRLASRIQTVVTTFLFGACYLLIVPLFAVFIRFQDPLGLRRREGESSWVPTRPEAKDARSYQRMG